MKYNKKNVIVFFIILAICFGGLTVLANYVDQQNNTGGVGIGFGDTGSNRDYMCQGFVPQAPTITAISFDLNGVGSVGMLVWFDTATAANTSSPSHAGLANVGYTGLGPATEIPNATLSTAYKKYDLSKPVKVTPGGNHVVCFAPWNTSTHAWASDYRDVNSSTANPYASKGRRTHFNANFNSISAPDSGNADIVFTLWGEKGGEVTEE